MPKIVHLVEVSPRDGLQNEMSFISSADKIKFINLLSQSGLKRIEITSFVSHEKIPQLADASVVSLSIDKQPNIEYSALVPNRQGLQAALQVGIQSIALFTAASETFCQKNIGCSIQESLNRFNDVMLLAKQRPLKTRAYISCAFVCPYEGVIDNKHVLTLARQLIHIGCDEICLGDTIGKANPYQVTRLLRQLIAILPTEKIALHFHDTFGQALTNIFASLELGIRIFDTAVSGLGGCPYATGATGNVSTEDVWFLLQGLGFETGLDIKKLRTAGNYIDNCLKRTTHSKTARALSAEWKLP